MSKAPKNTRRTLRPGKGVAHDSRAKALAAMTKKELIKTIKSLDKRQTQLLNNLALSDKRLEAASVLAIALQKRVDEFENTMRNLRIMDPVSGPELSTHGTSAFGYHDAVQDVRADRHVTPLPLNNLPWSKPDE